MDSNNIMFTTKWWVQYCDEITSKIECNFYGNLSILRDAIYRQDPYALQLEEMGYHIRCAHPTPVRFMEIILWIQAQKCYFAPVLVLKHNKKDLFAWVPFFKDTIRFYNGEEVKVWTEDTDFTPTSEVFSPFMFTVILADKCFPIGGASTAGTNQSLAEHDIAHMASFVANAKYASNIWSMFQTVYDCVRRKDTEIINALAHFDSILSLRLYYFVEVATAIRDRDTLKKMFKTWLEPYPTWLMAHTEHNTYTNTEHVFDYLKKMHHDKLYMFLSDLYEKTPAMLEPLGGESRDIMNRVRKHNRGFYATEKGQLSKFAGSSIYSLYLEGLEALQLVRPDHSGFEEALQKHAHYITTLLGTSMLPHGAWKHAVLDLNNDLRKYLTESGVWDKSHAIFAAFCPPKGNTLDTRVGNIVWEETQ